jgi:hypothetical protein
MKPATVQALVQCSVMGVGPSILRHGPAVCAPGAVAKEEL